MDCQEIIKELHTLAEGKKTDSSNEAVAEAIEIIEDWEGRRMDRMKKYTIWKLSGPHDTFEIVAENLPAACFKALTELGWGIDVGREEMAERTKMAQATLRFIPMLLKKNPKRWAIWDRKKNSWAESKTGHLFVYTNEEAANRKAEKLEEANR